MMRVVFSEVRGEDVQAFRHNSGTRPSKVSEGSIKTLKVLLRLKRLYSGSKTVAHNALSLNRSSHEGVMTIYFPQGAARRVVAQTAWRVSACSEYVCFCGPLSMSTHTLNGRVGGCGESG
jgi:hypothetical protein